MIDVASLVAFRNLAIIRRNSGAENNMSIYGNLFRYRPRPQRRPLEDFLSASLSDLLNRLSRKEQLHFIATVLIADQAIFEQLMSFVAGDAAANFLWRTQVRVPNGIADIVFFVGNVPAIVIESKIAAGFRLSTSFVSLSDVRASSENEAERIDANQMHLYGQWLHKSTSGVAWGGAIIALVHFSKPPSDFQASEYKVDYTATCRWRSIWSWLRKPQLSEVVSPELRTASELRFELAAFLESENMSSDYATSHDLIAARLYSKSAARLEQTFALAEEKLDVLKRSLGAPTSKFYGPVFNSDGPVIWAYIYFKGPARIRDNWHIAWGVMFPDSDADWWSGCLPKIPDQPFIFVSLQCDKEPSMPLKKLPEGELPVGWSSNAEEGELIICQPCHTLRQDPEGWATDFSEFVAAKCEQVRLLALELETKL